MTTSQLRILAALVIVVVAGIVGAVLSPDHAVQILGFCAVVVSSLLQQLQTVSKVDRVAAKQEQVVAQQHDTAHKVDEVKSALHVADEKWVAKLDAAAGVAHETHSLVNAAMMEQKRLYAMKCEQAAADNPTPVNLAEAKAARAAYEEHKARADAGKGTP